MNLRRLYRRLHDHLWDSDVSRMPPVRRLMFKILRLIVAVARDVGDGRLDERAGSLAYTTLMSFVPLLAVLFAIMRAFGIQKMVEPTLKSFLHPLGRSAPEVARRLVAFVDNIQINVLGYIGVAMLLYGVFAMIQKVEAAFNDIWRVDETRGLLRRLRDYLGVLVAGPLLLLASVAMTGAARHVDFVNKLLQRDVDWNGLVAAFGVLPYLLFVLAFTTLYMVMPNTRVGFRPALGAGIITGIVWKIMGLLFGIFVSGSASYAAIYSAFAALILFMLWIYLGWMAVLAGASLCYYLEHPSNMPLPRRRHLSLGLSEKLALQLCVEAGSVFYKKQPPSSLRELAARLNVPALAIRDAGGDLVAAGILDRQDQGFIPAKGFDTTSVETALRAIREAGEEGVLQARRLSAASAVDAVLECRDRVLHKELGRMTLQQLARGNIQP